MMFFNFNNDNNHNDKMTNMESWQPFCDCEAKQQQSKENMVNTIMMMERMKISENDNKMMQIDDEGDFKMMDFICTSATDVAVIVIDQSVT